MNYVHLAEIARDRMVLEDERLRQQLAGEGQAGLWLQTTCGSWDEVDCVRQHPSLAVNLNGGLA